MCFLIRWRRYRSRKRSKKRSAAGSSDTVDLHSSMQVLDSTISSNSLASSSCPHHTTAIRRTRENPPSSVTSSVAAICGGCSDITTTSNRPDCEEVSDESVLISNQSGCSHSEASMTPLLHTGSTRSSTDCTTASSSRCAARATTSKNLLCHKGSKIREKTASLKHQRIQVFRVCLGRIIT